MGLKGWTAGTKKRERGESDIHPAAAPVSRFTAMIRVCLRGQDLAALGTAAGQNLAAVGSSHSLTETVHLGAVTLAGLIGTLHDFYTSCLTSYAQQPPLGGRSNAF